MVRPLISKIRCNNPNKKSSPMRNHNLLVYIGSREGVDISNPELDRLIRENEENDIAYFSDEKISFDASNELNGLFGNIDTDDLHKLANKVAGMTRDGKNIYNGIISFHEEDAIRLGYDSKESWIHSMNAVMPDIAREFHIPVDSLKWAAAVHMESGHPHCHYMFWQENNKVRSSFIHPKVQDRCRTNISKVFLEADREAAVINKTLARDSSISMTKEEMKELTQLMNPDSVIPGRITSIEHQLMMEKMQTLINSLPNQGRVTYKLLPLDAKHIADDIVKDIIARPDIKKELEKYYDSVEQISDSYNANAERRKFNHSYAEYDIEKRLANVVVSTAKTIRYEEQQRIMQQKQMMQTAGSACFSVIRNSLNVIAEATRQNNMAESIRPHNTEKNKKKKQSKQHHER